MIQLTKSEASLVCALLSSSENLFKAKQKNCHAYECNAMANIIRRRIREEENAEKRHN